MLTIKPNAQFRQNPHPTYNAFKIRNITKEQARQELHRSNDDKDDYMQIIRDNQIEELVEVIDGYTPDNEVEKYFSDCDLVVLPYESAT